MNRKMFFFIGITSIAFLCSTSIFSQENNEAMLSPWMLNYSSDFKPKWELVPTVQATYDLFAPTLEIPVDAQTNEIDCSINFKKGGEKVTLFANGVRRTDRLDGSIEFFDSLSSATCFINSSGGIHASHLNKEQMNACSVSVEAGALVFKSCKILDDSKQQLNFLVRVRDGLSIVFEYHDDGTVVARESTGCVEIISRSDQIIVDILNSHGMVRPPDDALYVAEGMVCRDGEGITCYLVEGMKFHVAANGFRFCFSAPIFQVQLEGLISPERLLTRWKFCSSATKPYKKCRFDGVDILFDGDSGRSLLYINVATMQSGMFLYDGNGNYCKRSGVGGVRYGKITPMLTYAGVSAAAAKEPKVEQQGAVHHDFLSQIFATAK